MKGWMAALCVFGALVAAPAFGADEKPAKGARAGGVPFLKDIELTDDQKKQVAEVVKEFAPKIKEAREKADALVTPEARKAAEEKVAAAKGEGKKGKELNAIRLEALNLAPEKQKEHADAMAAMATITKERDAKIVTLLTDEQKKAVEAKQKKPKKDAA